jgi:VanZ family protein
MHAQLRTVRFGLAAFGAVLLVLMLGPFQGLEHTVGLTDKAAHAVAYYFVTLVAFAAFPDVRRTDTAGMVFMIATGIEAVQGFTNRTVSIADLGANSVGVLAAVLPAIVDRWRFHARVRLRQSEDETALGAD